MVLKLDDFIQRNNLNFKKTKADFLTEEEWHDLFIHLDGLFETEFSKDLERRLNVGTYRLFSNYNQDGFTWMNYIEKYGNHVYPYDDDNAEERERFLKIIAREYREAGWRVWVFSSDCFEIRAPYIKILTMKIKGFLQR